MKQFSDTFRFYSGLTINTVCIIYDSTYIVTSRFLQQLFFYIFLLSFKYSCLHLSPHHSPHPSHPHLPPSILPPLFLSMCPLYMFLKTLPSFPRFIPSHLPFGYCQFVLNFTVSGSVLLAYLFC